MSTQQQVATEEATAEAEQTPPDAKKLPRECTRKSPRNAVTKRAKPAAKLRIGEQSLTKEERKRWVECRGEIQRGFKACLGAYVEIGKRLATVRDGRLYREDFHSFEAYCRKELEIARSTAYAYITDYEVATELSTIADTSKLNREIDIRPVTSLQADERKAVIQLLKTKNVSGPLTPLMLKEVAAEVLSMRPPPPQDTIQKGDTRVVGEPDAGEISVSNPSIQNEDLPGFKLPADPGQHMQAVSKYFDDLTQDLCTLIARHPSLAKVVKTHSYSMAGTVLKAVSPNRPAGEDRPPISDNSATTMT